LLLKDWKKQTVYTVYTAELCEKTDTVRVSWNICNKDDETFYYPDQVQEYFEKGNWIILEEPMKTKEQIESEIQALQQNLAGLVQELQELKVEITYGDFARWNDHFYIIAKTPVYNNGKICGIRVEDAKGNVNWIDILCGVKENSDKYEFLKATENMNCFDLLNRNKYEWIPASKCKIVE
jgi:hypothetical protein